MKKAYFGISLFLVCCVSFGTGCQLQTWHLNARKEGDTVQLCLSNEPVCPQPGGVRPSGISVYRYDSMFDNELVWDAEPENPITNGRISGVVTYGIPPKKIGKIRKRPRLWFAAKPT